MFLWMIASVAAYFIKGLCGFANTLVFTSILAFGENNISITPVELVLGCPANAVMAWRYRHEANWRIWLPVSLTMFIGIIPGTFFLKNLDGRIIKLIFGGVIILLGLEMLLRERQKSQQKNSKAVMTVISVISGILCGLYGVGALLAAYLSRTTKDVRAFKGSLSVVFLLENLFRITLYSVTGVFTASILIRAAMMLPFMGLGLFLGIFSSGRLNDQTARKIVVVMLIVSGITLVYANIS